jgi:hypothetical protein
MLMVGIPVTTKKSIQSIGQIPVYLFHPPPVGFRDDPCEEKFRTVFDSNMVMAGPSLTPKAALYSSDRVCV